MQLHCRGQGHLLLMLRCSSPEAGKACCSPSCSRLPQCSLHLSWDRRGKGREGRALCPAEGTDAALASDTAAQVSAPPCARHGGFGSSPWARSGGAPLRSSLGPGQGRSRRGLESWGAFLGGRSSRNMALLLGSARPSPASSSRERKGGISAQDPLLCCEWCLAGGSGEV